MTAPADRHGGPGAGWYVPGPGGWQRITDAEASEHRYPDMAHFMHDPREDAMVEPVPGQYASSVRWSLRLRAARHELRCWECRVTWRSLFQRLAGIKAGYTPTASPRLIEAMAARRRRFEADRIRARAAARGGHGQDAVAS